MSKIKKFFKNPWTIGIGTAVFSFLLTVFYDLIKQKPILSTIENIFNAIGNGIWSFLNFDLKIWWILIGVAIVILALWLYSKYLDTKKETPPLFLEYTKDEILDFKWEWEWVKNYSGKYEAQNICPICKKCGTPLVRKRFGDVYGLECLRCGQMENQELPDEGYIKMMIHDNVKRKYFDGKEE